MKIVLLEYNFMFDPSESWQHLWQFEQDLSNFFNAHGFEAQIIKTIEGQSGKRVLFIKKKGLPIVTGEPEKQGRPQTLKGKFKEMSNRELRKPAKEFENKKFKLGEKVMKKAQNG